MSIRDLNKIIILSSHLTGSVVFQISLDDYLYCIGASNYFNYKLSELIENGEGAIITIGYKD